MTAALSVRTGIAAGVCTIIIAIAAAIFRLEADVTLPLSEARAVPVVPATTTITRGTFVRSIRLTGFIEAVAFTNIMAPSVVGQTDRQLVVQKLASNGIAASRGDVLVEFDRQQQLRIAREKEAEWLDRDTQLRQKRAEREIQAAKDETEVSAAEVALDAAKLESLKNELLPRVEARKNELTLRSARETLNALREWIAVARAADNAALRVIEVRRNRSELLMRQALRNADRMAIRAPIDGLVVLKTTWRNGGSAALIEEGQSLWSGSAVMDLIGPGPMRVRTKVSEVDAARLRIGQMATVRLDSRLDLVYPAYLETISPVAVRTGLSSNVRTLTAVFRIDKAGAALAPDVSAAVDVELERREGVVLAPRDALVVRGEGAFLSIQTSHGPQLVPVTIGSMNELHVIITAGVKPGSLVFAASEPPVSFVAPGRS
jgi:multidrug resistance efflux pump